MSFDFPELIVSNGLSLPNCIDYSKLQVTKEGLYSTLMPIHADQEINAIKSIISKKEDASREDAAEFCQLSQNNGSARRGDTVLDTTGNMGCYIMTIASYFPNIEATVLEINPDTYDILCSNIKSLKLTNITPINISCYEFVQKYNDTPFTYIYCDPPWSSVEKYNKNKIYDDLFLMHDESYVSVFDFIALIFEKQMTELVILKTPSKFNTYPKLGKHIKYVPIYNAYKRTDYRLYFITPMIMRILDKPNKMDKDDKPNKIDEQ
jgi:hypothetical protein